MELGLTGKACIVTGASRGIGLATARALAHEGASLLLVARSQDGLDAARAACGSEHVETIAADVTDPAAAQAVAVACTEAFGRVDVLVNNAGTSELKPLDELTDQDWQAQWELHVMGPLRLMRECAPQMEAGGYGRIVNVTSSSGKRPSLRNAAYSVTKAAQLSLSRAFADAWAGRGVLVNAVAPGIVESELWLAPGGLADQTAAADGKTREQVLEEAAAKVPRGRFATPDEIAAVIVMLCSERASNVIGAAWSVDGGTVPVII